MKHPLNGKTWPTILAFLLIVLVALWQFVIKRDFLSYGPPEKSYLSPTIVKAGDSIEVCFDDIEWYRIPYSATVKQYYICNRRTRNGTVIPYRFDMESHAVNYPSSPQHLPPKCRVIAHPSGEPYPVPSWCEPGPLQYGGTLEATAIPGALTLYYNLPANMMAQIVAKGQ
jgi:hypothetical protein